MFLLENTIFIKTCFLHNLYTSLRLSFWYKILLFCQKCLMQRNKWYFTKQYLHILSKSTVLMQNVGLNFLITHIIETNLQSKLSRQRLFHFGFEIVNDKAKIWTQAFVTWIISIKIYKKNIMRGLRRHYSQLKAVLKRYKSVRLLFVGSLLDVIFIDHTLVFTV